MIREWMRTADQRELEQLVGTRHGWHYSVHWPQGRYGYPATAAVLATARQVVEEDRAEIKRLTGRLARIEELLLVVEIEEEEGL